MELRVEDTVIRIPEEARDADPNASIRPLSEQPTLSAAGLPAIGMQTAQRTMPRISIDLGEERTVRPDNQGADLEVTGLLGEGGMGRVLLARQHTLQRDVAVKVLRDEADEQHRAALLEEGAIVGSLEHPAILPVHALGLDEQRRPILVMKRIQGVPMSDLLEDPKHPLWEERRQTEEQLTRSLEILIQICNAAQFAHEHGVLHLDIKPSNIMVGGHGDIYLVDWGVARRIDGGRVGFAGTPACAAPEMVAGEALDPRTDVYLLGATLHTLLTGEPRHQGETVLAVFAAAVQSEPYEYADDVPPELAALANNATARAADDRPQSADAFRRALAAFLEHRSSAKLTQSALSRIDELKPLLQGEARGEGSQRIDELAVEARFALKQALELWPGNEEAERAYTELKSLHEERRARVSQLRRIARDHDKSLSARQRAITAAGLSMGGMLATGIGIYNWYTGNERSLTELTLEAACITAVGMGMLVYFRRDFMRSHPNRVAGFTLFSATWSVLLSRIVGLLADTALPDVLARDCFIAGAIITTMTLSSSRLYLLVSMMCICGATLSSLQPQLANLSFSIVSGVSLVLVAFAELFSYRRHREDNDDMTANDSNAAG